MLAGEVRWCSGQVAVNWSTGQLVNWSPENAVDDWTGVDEGRRCRWVESILKPSLRIQDCKREENGWMGEKECEKKWKCGGKSEGG